MNLNPVRLIIAITLSSLAWSTAQAQLKWDQTSLELHPAIGDATAVGHFKYVNAGKTPVRFRSARPSCGCTVAQFQKEEVKPGEKGEITATFSIGDRVGTQVKTVTVETDETPSAITVLTLKAVLPEMLTLIPTFVYWNPGEEPKPKMIMAKAGKGFSANTLTVASSNPEFETKVEPGKAPGEWTISVQPKQTTRAAAAALTIRPDFPKGSPRSFYANASVIGTPMAPPAATTPPLPK
jgi:hypothetical protein